MVIPAAMNIETGFDALAYVEKRWLDDQEKELRAGVGASSAEKLGVAYPLSREFVQGYQLGIETARAIVAGSVEVLSKGGNPENVL